MNEPIKDKTPKPPGLLPKNVQSWVILGIATLMILIMWLTSGKKEAKARPAVTPETPAPVEVNEAKVADLQNRIEELQREQLAAQSALAQESRLLQPTASNGDPSQGQAVTQSTTPPTASTAGDELKAEHRKREYLSLFSSNVALTYRKVLNTSNSVTNPSSPEAPLNAYQNPDALQLGQIPKEALPQQQQVPFGGAQIPHSPDPAITPKTEANSQRPDSNHSDSVIQTRNATGSTHVLFEGTILETILVNRLDGQFAGPVQCLLANDIYSQDRQHLLIPAGSKLLGEIKKVEAFGQTRLAITFHRLIMPDGYSVTLDQFKGLDQIGDTGLRDQVNNHYLRIFGTSLAIGAIGAAAEVGTNGPLTASGSDTARQGFAASSSRSAEQILDRFLNLPPTVTIREGHRVKVYLAGDLLLPDYRNHKMPSDL